jgi:hypothetical protein
MMYQKHTYIRSPKLMRLVRKLRCQNCKADDGTVCGAHTNWGGGKGKAVKADDNLIAALCHKCHIKIDQGSTLSKAERQDIWERAHLRTVHHLVIYGLWPKEVPLPLQYLRIEGIGADF